MLHLVALAISARHHSDKLVSVVEAFRHGARYPSLNMPDSNFDALHAGNLTDIGKLQHYYLGAALRHLYFDLHSLIDPRASLKD